MALEEEAWGPATSLRWVKYDDVYYAALLVPSEEAPDAVPEGHSFVYFLGTEYGAAVPTSDVHPYDPNDTTRTSHPSAAAGVLAAHQLIFGDVAIENKAEEAEVEDTLRRRRVETSNGSNSISRRSKGKAKETKRKREDDSEKGSDKDDDTTATRSRNRDSTEEENVDDDNYNNEQHKQWRDMEDDLNITEPSLSNDFSGNKIKNQRHPIAGRQATHESILDPHGGSIVSPFLAEIRHHYRAKLTEAVERDQLLNIQESDLVRVVEAELCAWRAEVLYLQRLLHDAKYERRNVLETRPAYDSDVVTPEDEEVAEISSRLERLKISYSVEQIVQKHLHLKERPPDRRERKRATGTGMGVGGRSFAFTDASLSFLLDSKAVAAVPRELTQQLARRYREQRMRREQLLSEQQGLGKMGFTSMANRVMEKWRRSRELMVLDPRHESQHVSHRYSESLAKVERHALKCLTAPAPAPSSTAERELLLSTYRTQQKQQQERRKNHRTVANLYNFHNLQNEERETTSVYQASSTHPYMSGGGMYQESGGGGVDDDDDNTAPKDFQAPLISPLRTSFDPRATFAIDFGEIAQKNQLAEQLAMQSMQYSHSIYLPSQETVWANSEAYDGSNTEWRGRQRRGHSRSRMGSMSRHTSRASSAAPETKKSNINHDVTANSDRQSCNDWRGLAKRAILEQLTLYLRGIRGKPMVLSKDQFTSTAKKLLERAVRSESERTGLSMSLQANNATAPFTKEVEARLRKSVDNYVQRHFVSARTPTQQSEGKMAGRSEPEGWATARRDDEDDDEMHSVMGAYPHATDSPVYDE